ncbi:MAG: radical SAM protein [Candidatus Portnoybacteria bacterium]|nr:radical SAM protein [Candidatus Portnoybacteria bacterium]
MRITLVQPPLTLEERYGVKHQSGGETIPLGLAYLASSVRAAGHKTKIIDAEINHWNLKEATKKIMETTPDLIGLTAVTISIDNAARVAEEAKKIKPEVIVLIGGHHFTTAPEETLNLFPVFDIGVLGEGEETLVELAAVLEKYGLAQDELKKVKGLIFKDEAGNFIRTPVRERIKNLDALPKPAFDLLGDITIYSPPAHTVRKFPACTLVASRGCPGQCTFCTRSIYGNILSQHSAQYMLDMVLELYHKYGIREVQFRDDNFTVFRDRLLEFCKLLKAQKINFVWTALGRVDMVDPEMLRAMKEAGCWQIWVGVESGNNEILKLIKKYTTKEKITQAIKWIKEAGMGVGAFFIMGHPGETKETIRETIDLALSLPIDEFHCTFLTPLPGSEIYRTWKKYGVFHEDWKNLNEWRPVFIPFGVSQEEMERYSKMFYRKFYFRPRIDLNYLKKVRSPRHLRIYFSGFLALLDWVFKRKASAN